MTAGQRNAAIKRRIKRKTKQLMRDVDTAMRWLVEHGYYNEDGTLTAAYGGKDMDKAAFRLNEMMEEWHDERRTQAN